MDDGDWSPMKMMPDVKHAPKRVSSRKGRGKSGLSAEKPLRLRSQESSQRKAKDKSTKQVLQRSSLAIPNKNFKSIGSKRGRRSSVSPSRAEEDFKL